MTTYDNMTTRDREIIWGLSHWLEALWTEHPEVARVKVRCMREDESLLFDWCFSRKDPPDGGERGDVFEQVKQTKG